jgi:Flp pilus assembly CpaE family ATPase
MHPPLSLEVTVSALGVLRSRFDHVIVDAGEVISSVGSGGAAGLLQAADRVVLVSGADLVALWNARGAMRYLREGLGLSGEKLGVVLNRREGREHYAAAEVARALAAPVLASVPEDRRAARRAIAEQSPIVSVGGPAASELRALAGQLLSMGAPRDSAAPARRLPFGLRRSLARRG